MSEREPVPVPLPRLSVTERTTACVEGGRRKIIGDLRREKGEPSRRDEHYLERVSWDQEIEAVAAEIGVAKWMGTYWTGASAVGGPGTDAGAAQVRWTQHEGGHLMLYEGDDPEHLFMLVTGYLPNQLLRGGVFAGDGMIKKYWREPPEARCKGWWVPIKALYEVDSTRSSRGATVTDAHHIAVVWGDEGGLLLSSPPTVSPSPFEGVEIV